MKSKETKKRKRMRKIKVIPKDKNKVKKYFEHHLKAGDFVLFPSGQRYKVMKSGRTSPACMTEGCKKLAQVKVIQTSNCSFLFKRDKLRANILLI